jgi:hypothetical protein
VFEILLYPRYQARAKSRSKVMEHISYTSGQETKKFPLVNLMFCLCWPEMQGHGGLKVNVNLDELDMAVELCCSEKPKLDCSVEFLQLAQIIMTEQIIDMPVSPEDARIKPILVFGE